MNRVILSILFTCIVSLIYAQQIEISPKYQQKLNQISDPYKKSLKYTKYYQKDSLKRAKAQLKEQIKRQGKRAVNDSLASIPGTDRYRKLAKEVTSIDSAKVANEAKRLGEQELSKEIDIQSLDIPLDSTIVDQATQEGKKKALQEIKANNELGEYVNVLEGVQLDSLDNVSIDSLGAQGKDLAIKKGEEYLKNTDEGKALSGLDKDSELSKLTGHKDQLEKAQADLRKAAQQDALKKQMTSKAKDFITNNAQQIQQVHNKMTDLKKKYSAVPNSKDLSTATKRKSLKGEPFMKRLVLGGNFNISKTNPVSIDISPVLGYRINKLFKAGVSLTYRTHIKGSNSSITNDESVYGQGLWANHTFYKNYFGYIEGERMSTVTEQDDIKIRSWKESLLIGVGRKFNITKWLEMQAMVLVNPLHKNTDQLYSSPVVFKTGIRVKP